MIKKGILTAAMAVSALWLNAETHEVTDYLYVGPSVASQRLVFKSS